jgi:hypothetical protein
VTLLGRARNGPSRDAVFIMSTPERLQFKSDDGLFIACMKRGNGRDVIPSLNDRAFEALKGARVPVH